MVKKLKRKGDASTAPAPKATAPGSAKPDKFKKKVAKTDPEKLKAAAVESAAIAEASASAPAPKTVEVNAPAAAATPNGVSAESSREDRSTTKETMKGREERGKEDDRKTSKKEMMKWREEERMNRDEKRRRTTGKEKDEDGDGPGFIFMCSVRTKPECYRNGVFGLPRAKMDVVERIRPGAKLFLYDFELKLMYGVYKATTRGGLDLVRHAFDGKFPAQVKFSVDIDCLPIPESSFKHAIKENYNSKGRFTQELSSKQVHRLLALFKPIGLSQPAPQRIEEVCRPHIVEDRREPYDYDEGRPSKYVEERGAPINVHASPLEDHYEITHSLCPPLLNEPHHSLVQHPHQMPIGLESHQAPLALGSHHAPHTRELQHVPPMYYHQVAPSSSYHQPHVDTMHGRNAAEATVRDPLLARDYGALPGELAACSERVDELYRSYKLSTRAMELHPGPSYVTTSYENPRSVYSENLQRPVLARVNGPSLPVSTRYSFASPPAYR
uniref:DCD domain-containing protein n=1 Tax=Arundo donax TaxID=35708 RepID=A0A0A9DJM6_ARUDO